MDISKTRLLSASEASSLRARLKACFAQRHPEKKPVEPKTYLGAYEELRSDILAIVPEANSSISLNRLRKLIYYTDPEACAPEKMEVPSFGKDFIDALERYIEKGPQPAQTAGSRENNLKKPVTVLLLLLPVAVLSWLIFAIYLKPAEPWREDFDDVSREGLESHGWELWDYNAAYFNRQTHPGMLTVYTLPGDFWVKPREKREITNLIVRPIGANNVVITIKIVGFYPRQGYQQIGMLLLNENKMKTPHLRVSYAIGVPHTWQTIGGYRKVIGNLELVAIQVNSQGEVFPQSEMLREIPEDKGLAASAYPDTVFIRLEIRDRLCRLHWKFNSEWDVYRPSKEIELSFDPAFLGIGAFQGWTNDDGTPKGADIIPGYIEWIEVRPLDGNGTQPGPK